MLMLSCSSAALSAVEEFQIKFPLDSMLVDHLNNWVKFAVSSRAKNLAIDLEPEDFRCCEYRHMFPFELFNKQSMSRLEVIRLSLVSLKAPPHFSGFPNLKALDLRVVDVSSNDLQLVLSSCFNLEKLGIVLCHLRDDIRLSCPLPRLQHLHVAHSYISKIQFIAKNLTTFVYDGFMVPLDLSETLQLRHTEMNFPWLTLEHAITELPRAIPHAQNLNLSAYMTLEVLHLPEGVSKFSHLKHLQLRLHLYGPSEDNLLSLASFLKAAPLLEVLDIHVLEYALLEDSFEANVRDYTKLIQIYGKQMLLQKAEEAFHAMKGRGFPCDQVMLTALMDMYSKDGDLTRAKETFEEIVLLGLPLDKRAYGSMIMAYIRADMLDKAEGLIKQTEDQQIFTGKEVYKALLRAYSYKGNSDGAQ